MNGVHIIKGIARRGLVIGDGSQVCSIHCLFLGVQISIPTRSHTWGRDKNTWDQILSRIVRFDIGVWMLFYRATQLEVLMEFASRLNFVLLVGSPTISLKGIRILRNVTWAGFIQVRLIFVVRTHHFHIHIHSIIFQTSLWTWEIFLIRLSWGGLRSISLITQVIHQVCIQLTLSQRMIPGMLVYLFWGIEQMFLWHRRCYYTDQVFFIRLVFLYGL